MVDNRGVTLKVGQEVAYNISGQIAKGKILNLKQGKKSSYGAGYFKSRITIELLHDAGGFAKGHNSIVSNPLNVLVIYENR